MYRIAITGANGFLGCFIANYLESEGFFVYRFSRNGENKTIPWDITLKPYDKNLNIDCVIHCAALVDDWADKKESYIANVIGTKNVALSFNEVKKFIYISSASVYDQSLKDIYINETALAGRNLLNAYSLTKFQGEEILKNIDIDSVIILRPHVIYGKGDKYIGPSIKKSIKHGCLFLPGDGKNYISLTNIKNLALAIKLVIESKVIGFQIYNIADKEEYTLSNAIQRIKKLNNLTFKPVFINKNLMYNFACVSELAYKILNVKKAPLLSRYKVNQLSSNHIFDIKKAQKILHYNPQYNIDNDFII